MIHEKKQSSNSFKIHEDHIKRLLRAFPKGLVVFDLETTGLSSLCDKIIEIGAIKVAPSGEYDVFSTLIDPEIEILAKSTAIHGITNKMVAGAPKIKDAILSFKDFIQDLPLVAHNAQFDVGFMIFQFHCHDILPEANEVYCSCQYSRRAIKKSPNHKLSTLCEFLDIQLENHHRATDDALAALEVLSYAIKGDAHLSILPRVKIYQLDEFKNIKVDSPIHSALNQITKDELGAKMKYEGGSHKNKWRPIRPVGLMPTPRGDVLYAHCLVSDLYKSFLVKKISDVEACNEVELISLKESLQ